MKKKYTQIGFLTLALLIIFVWLFFRNREVFDSYRTIDNSYTNIEIGNGESCMQCHQNMKGYSNYHDPELIGCASCHLGDISSLDKDEAHKGMILMPGNLSDAKETCGKCHFEELRKVNNSLMTTNSGLVAVDKFVFGEADSPNYHYHIKDLGHSPADMHMRDLCANCHLGAEKPEIGEITQLSRGGGCIACHLNYTEEAKSDLAEYLASDKKKLPEFHPSTDIFVNNTHCFGCHSRSSRISTNYIGLQETLLDEIEIGKNSKDYSVLEDMRVYKQLEADVHHTKGLLCIDCHSSHEVMGTGEKYLHQEEAVSLQCSDCHFKEKPRTMKYDSLDRESLLVYLHRDYKHDDKNIIAVEEGGHPLVNTYVDSTGNAFLISKKDRSIHPLQPQAEECSRNAHQNVSCSACHSSWTSRCIGCHNQFDKDEPKAFDLLDKKYVTGQWKEYVAEFSSSQPALGVRKVKEKTVVEPAIPGMVLTIDKGSFKGNPGEDVSFHRLYAPNSPHTTTKQVRDCKSCHSNSAALGYGMGSLVYEIKNNKGSWVFTPEYALNSHDDLPEDAWIPFLKETDKNVVNSTRTNFRPFNVEEQKQMLLVGACLQCHKDNSKVMRQTLELGLQPVLKKVTKECILPQY